MPGKTTVLVLSCVIDEISFAKAAMYIDYRAMVRDMEYGGDLFTLENNFEQLHVFWNR